MTPQRFLTNKIFLPHSFAGFFFFPWLRRRLFPPLLTETFGLCEDPAGAFHSRRGGWSFSGKVRVYWEMFGGNKWQVGSKPHINAYDIPCYMYEMYATTFRVITYGGFLKLWYPTTIGFPTKNDHFGVWNGGTTIQGNTHIADDPATNNHKKKAGEVWQRAIFSFPHFGWMKLDAKIYGNCEARVVLLMVQKTCTIWDGAKTLVNNGINYQPQLVSLPEFFPSTFSTLSTLFGLVIHPKTWPTNCQYFWTG